VSRFDKDDVDAVLDAAEEESAEEVESTESDTRNLDTLKECIHAACYVVDGASRSGSMESTLMETSRKTFPPSPPASPLVAKSDESQSPSPTQSSSTSDLNSLDIDGTTTLIQAIRGGDHSQIEDLLRRDADVEKPCKQGTPPLIHGVEQGDMSLISLLRRHRPNLNLENPEIQGMTAIHVATRSGDLGMAELLLDLGANVEATTSAGTTALHYACQFGQVANAELLLRRGSKVKAEDLEGWSSIHHTVHGSGGEEIIRLLLENNVDVNARCKTKETPLHFAVKHDKKSIARLLLDAQADANAKDSAEDTPLHIAGRDSNCDLVSLLLKKGAKYDDKALKEAPRGIRDLLLEEGSPADPKREPITRRFSAGSGSLPASRSSWRQGLGSVS
jgi:ankyrin repeat protein